MATADELWSGPAARLAIDADVAGGIARESSRADRARRCHGVILPRGHHCHSGEFAIYYGDLAIWREGLIVRVEVLAYPGCFASEVYGIPDLLLMAHHSAARTTPLRATPLQVAVVGARRQVRAAGGLDLAVETAQERDILVVPGFEFTQSLDLDELLHRLHPEIDLIKDQARSGAPIVSVCVGAFLLAEAGVLDGRRVTTSWLFAQRLAHRYPAISVDADALVLTDTGVTTSAGFSAMYDVALTLVQREHGPDVARSVARLALVDDARSSQTPYVDLALLPADESDFIAAAKSLLAERLKHPYNLADIARGLHVSPRTLLRRFKHETGQTPLQYVQSSRVARARHLLETTDLTLARIASDVGYHDASSFSVLFTRHTGHTPSRYRGAFGRSGRSS